MYNHQELPVRPDVEEPLELPLRYLLVIPDYVKSSSEGALFNLPGAINVVMGSAGWHRALKVMVPEIWAPHWNDEQLRRFVNAPFQGKTLKDSDVSEHGFRSDFPSNMEQKRYDIVHLVGGVTLDGIEQFLDLRGAVPHLFMWPAVGAPPLDRARTRLLIIQHPFDEARRRTAFAKWLARQVVNSGGPAVLTVEGQDPEKANLYFLQMIANIIHNIPLSEACRPGPNLESDLSVELMGGRGLDELLQFHRLISMLSERVESVRRIMEPVKPRAIARGLLDEARPYLHISQLESLEAEAEATEAEITREASRLLEMTEDLNRELNFAHETGGAIPLAERGGEISEVESRAREISERYPQIVAELEREVVEQTRHAPRVLNAGFFDPSSGREICPRDAMLAGKEYDFLVDVGPKWSRLCSLVIGNGEFPENAIATDDPDGYLIHVVFITQDFEPNISSSWIWVPHLTGRSFPYDTADKRRGTRSGPIAFRLRTPSRDAVEDVTLLHGRVCLYYRNNLIQSAAVRMAMAASSGATLESDNVVEVDFVLSGTLQDLERFDRRVALASTATDECRVALNITLNDDGSNSHRIVVRQFDEDPSSTTGSPMAWLPYDPGAAERALEKARTDLKSCFYDRDEKTGAIRKGRSGNPVLGLGADNGRTKVQFMWDLLTLAELGARLFDSALGQVRPSGNGSTPAAWTRTLQETLGSSSIIQIARTGPANYVFPWSLIYQYPLPGPRDRYQFCAVTDEWDDNGRRSETIAGNCPHRHKNWHAENVICPYGFWGLNHVIEQPLSALKRLEDGTFVPADAIDAVTIEQDLDLSIGITRALPPDDLDRLNVHLTRLGKIQRVRRSPIEPADDMDKVRSMLKTTSMVYFLCHGEYDSVQREPYLGVGLQDDNPLHRIYPGTLQAWARTPDLKSWQDRRPLVFINGCHTADLKPGELLNFVTAFSFAGASGVIGTEVSILMPVAVEISELLLEKLAKGVEIGAALHEIRWRLANRGNLIGLAYTLYCLANLRFTNREAR